MPQTATDYPGLELTSMDRLARAGEMRAHPSPIIATTDVNGESRRGPGGV
jgi:hypothetical protein